MNFLFDIEFNENIKEDPSLKGNFFFTFFLMGQDFFNNYVN